MEQIKSEADLTPAKTDLERKASAMLMKECIEKNKDVVESSKLIAMRCFKFSEDKIMYISENKKMQNGNALEPVSDFEIPKYILKAIKKAICVL